MTPPGDVAGEELVEAVKAVIRGTFAPAIDFDAPYARFMLAQASRGAVQAMLAFLQIHIEGYQAPSREADLVDVGGLGPGLVEDEDKDKD
jgi:hypothetical protein